jgi:hypothetical protein
MSNRNKFLGVVLATALATNAAPAIAKDPAACEQVRFSDVG